MVCGWGWCGPCGSSRPAPARVLPRIGCVGPLQRRHPSPRRSLRARSVRPSLPRCAIIAATRAPTSMPRFNAAASVATGAIRTRPSLSSRRRAAVSARARPAAAASAAATVGPSPCRSCAVARLPPRRACVAGAAVSHRFVLSPASSRLPVLLWPPTCTLASACIPCVACGVVAVGCPSPCAAVASLAGVALSMLPEPRPSRCRCTLASSRRCRSPRAAPCCAVDALSCCSGAPTGRTAPLAACH